MLHPELQKYTREIYGWVEVKHPYVFSIPHHESFDDYINKVFQYKKEAIQNKFNSKEWEHYINLFEKPFRLLAFNCIKSYLNNQQYWNILREIWISSENIYENTEEWKNALSRIEGRELFMQTEDKLFLDSLPEEFPIYRGQEIHHQIGLSWTINKQTAIWFAKRFNAGTLLSGFVNKKDVLGFLNDRNEQEIIVINNKIKGVEYEHI